MQKILVVDDEIEILNLLTKKLTLEGFSVVAAANGEDAVNLAASEQPDLVLLDIILPDMDGSDVVQRLRSHPAISKSLPIIFLSGIISKDEEKFSPVKVAGRNYPAISKPIALNHLVEEIKRALPE